MDKWLNMPVTGGGSWPAKKTNVSFGGHELILLPATKDTEQSIHINLAKTPSANGITIQTGMTLINRFLSLLSWCDDQPMEVHGGWAGNPQPTPTPRLARSCGSSISFPFGRELEPDPKAQLALALFREARSINSVPYAFLGYFKILNIFWNDKKDPKTKQNPLVEGIRDSLAVIQDLLALERLRELKSKHQDVPYYLYQSGRCAVAHAFSYPVADPDHLETNHRLSRDLPIIKAIAEHKMITDLKLSRSIIG